LATKPKNLNDKKAEWAFVSTHDRNYENVTRKEKKLIQTQTQYFDGLATMNSMDVSRVGDRTSWSRWFRDYADPYTLSDYEGAINFISILHHMRLEVGKLSPNGFDPASRWNLR
jgi:hypothetical protein